mgnify:CR=1 FL=1
MFGTGRASSLCGTILCGVFVCFQQVLRSMTSASAVLVVSLAAAASVAAAAAALLPFAAGHGACALSSCFATYKCVPG